MAILKDLIVHGSSRFLNKIYASEIQTPLIEADAGVFKKLKADDATIVGLLDVQGQLHTNSWTNSNIATIDGSFYITPTLSSSSGTVSFSSATAATFAGTYSAVSSLYVGNNTASTVQWTSGSKILITGEVQVDGEWTPLGTLLGTLNSTNPTTSMPIVSITDNKNNPSTILADIYSLKSNTSLTYRNLKVSLYQRADNSEYYPLGIFMTALGQNGKTFLDIYGGVNALTTSYGGYADPNVRIGNLSGLPAITTAAGNFSPVGWGIYTTNGYFSGTVVSSTGVIGGWRIGASSLYNGTTGLNNNTAGIYLGTNGIRNYKDSNTYVNITEGVITAKGVNLTGQITATSGTIAGWTIKRNYLITGDNSGPGANILMLNGNGTTGSYTIAGTASAGWMITAGTTFGVNKDGGVYATSGSIAGWSFDTNSFKNGTWGTDNSAIICTGTSTAKSIGGSDSISGWVFTAGANFGVTKMGNLYANSAHISGEITATSGTIGGASITDGTLIIPAANVSGELTAATINGSKITANTITASQIATNAITADELAANAVTSAKIKAGEVKATNIASNAVTADKLDATTINASNKLTVGALTTTDQNNILNSNIQIGGTNLLKNSNDLTKWSKESGLTVTWDSTVNMYKVVDTSHTSSKWGIYQDLDIKPNTTYTFSIWGMKSEDTSTSSAVGTFASSLSWPGTNSSTYTTTMSRSSVTFTSGADHVKCRVYLYLNPTANSSKTGYFYRPKLEEGNKVTDWSPAPEDIDVHQYITDIDSNKGITIKPADTSGNDYLQINSSAITTYRNNIDVMSLGDSSFRMGTASGKHTTVNSNGLHVWIGSESTAANEVGLFGSTARIGAPASSRFLLNADSLQAYNSSNVKYFEVSASGLSFGGNAVAKVSDIPTTVAELTDSGSYLTTTVASNTYATQTNLNNVTGWSVIINISAINYTTNTAILKATVYKDGVVQTSGFTLQWYKTETSTSATPQVTKTSLLTGQTNNTLEIKTTPTGDAYADTLDAAYTCIVS